MLRGSPWHRHRHHPRGSSRPAPAPCPDTPGTALRPQSLPPVAPDSLGSCTLTCCTRGPMRPPDVPCSPSWLREDPGSVPRAPGQGEASRPRGHCHSLPGASCGHCPAPLLLTGFAPSPSPEESTEPPGTSPAPPRLIRDHRARPQGEMAIPVWKSKDAHLGTENLGTKFRAEQKQGTRCAVIPEHSPLRAAPGEAPTAGAGPAPHPAAAAPRLPRSRELRRNANDAPGGCQELPVPSPI